ncbi:MAG: amidohydrolase family protein [Gemmatimonadetes bacterium]|nr:amidohydrolase family protein [Gemmatimonadota bacterium]
MRALALATLLLVSLAPRSGAQVTRTERRKWLAPGTNTTDDPRRIPVPPNDGPVATLVLRGGRVWDGTGSAARAASVVITGNKIAAILPASSTAWPKDARVIDVAGKTVMPGLIDLHTHIDYRLPGNSDARATSRADGALRGVERLRFYIEGGITSIRDTGSDGETPFLLKEWVNEGRLAGPRVFAAGSLITGKGGHGAEVDIESGMPLASIREASGPQEWREAVRQQFRKGADFIKLSSHFSEEEVKAAVDEAHSLGIKVTVDAETFYIERAVRAGVDMVEHPLPRTDETIRLMAEKGSSRTRRSSLHPHLSPGGGYFGSTSRRFTFSDSANFAVVKKMKDAGVKLGIGTDLVSDWYRYLPWPYHEEMRQFVRLGYTVPEVLGIATRVNAELLDMGDKLGTLEVGKLADVLVVAGNPDVTLDDIAKVDLVIRDGRLQVQGGAVVTPRHEPVPPPPVNRAPGGDRRVP